MEAERTTDYSELIALCEDAFGLTQTAAQSKTRSFCSLATSGHT